jgi:hypothetical protein
VEGHELHLLALDGVNFPKVRVIAPTPIPTTKAGFSSRRPTAPTS